MAVVVVVVVVVFRVVVLCWMCKYFCIRFPVLWLCHIEIELYKHRYYMQMFGWVVLGVVLVLVAW